MNFHAYTPGVNGPVVNWLCAIVMAATAVGATLGQAAFAGDGYAAGDPLLNPGEAVLLAERRGRVTIFDGIDDHLVDRALDRQFGRIAHMMFVRTRYVEQDGSVEFDDDCD